MANNGNSYLAGDVEIFTINQEDFALQAEGEFEIMKAGNSYTHNPLQGTREMQATAKNNLGMIKGVPFVLKNEQYQLLADYQHNHSSLDIYFKLIDGTEYSCLAFIDGERLSTKSQKANVAISFAIVGDYIN